MNHIVAGALMVVFGVLVTFGAATGVQYWHHANQPARDTGPVVDASLMRPAFDHRRRSNDCAPPLWPQPVNATALRQN